MGTDAFLRRALRPTKDTPGRDRSASTAMSGFGILKGRMGRTQKMCQKREEATLWPPCCCFMTHSGVMVTHFWRLGENAVVGGHTCAPA